MDPATLGPVAIVQVIAVWVIQKLKSANWFPWLTQNSAVTSRIVAYAIAVLTAAGITWQWNVAQGQLIINGLVWHVDGSCGARHKRNGVCSASDQTADDLNQ